MAKEVSAKKIEFYKKIHSDEKSPSYAEIVAHATDYVKEFNVPEVGRLIEKSFSKIDSERMNETACPYALAGIKDTCCYHIRKKHQKLGINRVFANELVTFFFHTFSEKIKNRKS